MPKKNYSRAQKKVIMLHIFLFFSKFINFLKEIYVWIVGLEVDASQSLPINKDTINFHFFSRIWSFIGKYFWLFTCGFKSTDKEFFFRRKVGQGEESGCQSMLDKDHVIGIQENHWKSSNITKALTFITTLARFVIGEYIF